MPVRYTKQELDAAGVAAENARCRGIAELAIPGFEAVIAECLADGDCTVEMAAVRLIQAAKQGRARLMDPVAELQAAQRQAMSGRQWMTRYF